MKNRSMDMTEGPLLKQIISFTIPIMLSSLLQLTFNAADLAVVGSYCGSIYLGAVGSTSSLVNLIVNFFIGLSVGVSVTTSHAIGMKDGEAIKRTVQTSIPTAIASGAMITVIGLIFSEPMLVIMGTPEDVLPWSVLYTRIFFCGAIFNMVYNFGAALLKADGDTTGPLVYLLISGVLNVILNIVFVTAFHMNVDGVALATVVSQALSAVLVIRDLLRRQSLLHLDIHDRKLSLSVLRDIMRIGLPAGLQSATFSVSNIIIQSSINSFGSAAMAGSAAAHSVEGYTYLSMNAFSQAATNFAGQNCGAGKYERTMKSIRLCLLCAAMAGVLMGGLTNLFSRTLLGIYIKDSEAAIEYGALRLLVIGLPYCICGMMDTMSGSMRGMGYSIQPMIITIVGACGFRLLWVFTVFRIPQYHSLGSLFLSYPISWALTLLTDVICLTVLLKRKRKKELNRTCTTM